MKELGENVKNYRNQQSLSLRELADRAGVTATYLSKIERGKSNPSVDIIRRIAQALGISIFNLLEGERNGKLVVRKSERLQIKPPHTQIAYELLTPDLQGNIEIFMVEVDSPKLELGNPIDFPTEECIIVLSGIMRICIRNEVYILEEGDSIRFDGQNLNSFKSDSNDKLIFISVVTPPIF